MKSWKIWRRTRLSLFWRYLLLLVTVMMMCLLVQFLVGEMYAETLQDVYLEQTEDTFQQNCQSLSSELGVLYSLPTIVENSPYYSYVSYIRGALPANRYFCLGMIRNSFVKQTTLLRMPKESFFIFKGSYSGGTRLRSFPDMDRCFSDYLIYEDFSAAQLREQIEAVNGIVLLPAQPVTIDDEPPVEFLTVLVNSSSAGSSLVIGILYPVDSILQAFGVDGLPGNSYLSITDSDGRELLHYHDADPADTYIEYEQVLSSLGCRVRLGIPQKWFRTITEPILRRSQAMLVIAFALGMLVCIWFSTLSVRPIRQLINDYLPTRPAEPQNELHMLSNYLEDTQQHQKELNSILFSSLLDRAFSGSSLDDGEIQQLSQLFPFLSGELCIAVIRALSDNRNMEDYFDGIAYIRETLPQDYYFKFINAHETGVLFQSDPAVTARFTQYLQSLNAVFEGDIRFICGISQPFCGLSSINSAFHQAYAAIPTVDEILVSHYPAEGRSGFVGEAMIDGQRLEQFYQALQQWDCSSAVSVLDQIGPAVSRSPYADEVITSLLYLLRDAAFRTGISFAPYDNLIHVHSQSPLENLHLLKEITESLFRQYSKQKTNDRWQLQQDVFLYIKETFSDSTLCPDTVATRFGVSIHFVNHTVQTLTGQSFSKWLLALRMKEAAALLQDTQENVEVIAARCGYPALSTFYRVFKKYHHVTPAQYRNGNGI